MGKLLTPAEAAEALGITRRRLAFLTGKGDVPVAERTPGGHRRYRATDIGAVTLPGPPPAGQVMEAAAREHARIVRHSRRALGLEAAGG